MSDGTPDRTDAYVSEERMSPSEANALANADHWAQHRPPETGEPRPTSRMVRDIDKRIVRLPGGGRRVEVRLGRAVEIREGDE